MIARFIFKSVVLCLISGSLFSNFSNRQNIDYNIAIPIRISDTLKSVIVAKDIKIKNYFNYLDSILNSINKTKNYRITEHLLVRYNIWIIDSLAVTDYYKMIEKDSFVYNQKEMLILKKGDRLIIPDSLAVDSLLNVFSTIFLDINVPEYKLRVCTDSIIFYEFPVRVGRNEKKYLKMGDRVTDLKTKIGIGKIVNHVKNPDYYNPVTGHQYFLTRRDDEKVTKLPQIPFLETEINGIRNGQLIHPTTNKNTLGKAYSNGCIGTNEGDAWIIYYYAPINTKVLIRYDLHVINKKGDTTNFKDVYGYKIKK